MKSRLILTADDLGISLAVNEAVLRAYRDGVLRCASLMVTGEAAQDAVKRVHAQCPGLGIGLHLVLCSGRSVLAPARLRGLVDDRGYFPDDPVYCGMRYFFDTSIHAALEAEIRAQFERFLSLGLPPGHVDGHVNIHMHPVIFPMLARLAREYGFKRLRAPGGELGYSLSYSLSSLRKQLAEGLGFGLLRRYLLRTTDVSKLEITDRVFGLLRSGLMHEEYLLYCLRNLPPGTTEIYFHPSSDLKTKVTDKPIPGHHTCTELQTLLSPEAKAIIAAKNINLVSPNNG